MLLSVAVAQAGQEVRLTITNGIYSDEMLVALHVGASDGFEMYDSPKMAVNIADYAEIYSFAGTQQVSINGIPPLVVNDVKEYVIGYRIGITSNLTICAKNIANLDPGTIVILKDNLLSVEKVLTTGSEYTFSTTKGEMNKRFCLIMKRLEVVQPAVTNTVVTDTVVSVPVVTNPVVADTVITAPIVTEPIVIPAVLTAPDFNVIVSSARTLEVQLLNLTIKGTKIVVNSINGRRILSLNATGNITSVSTPLSKGQYIVTVTNKNFSKSKNILVN